MFHKIFALILCFFTGIFLSPAQESTVPDSLLRDRDKVTLPALPDSLRFQQERLNTTIPRLEIQGMEPSLQQPASNTDELNLNDTIREPFLFLRPKFKPYTSFNIGASRWDMPLIGEMTTFSPMLTYQATKELSFYGGINLSQYHNLSYVQSKFAPNWPARSNITSDGFVGVNYRLFDRIILHGIYQRSLYNQLPGNMMMFAPGQNMVVTGASFDVWNGLGVSVDHVWQFDKYGNMRKGFRYSPYIDLDKFIKFLRQ